MDNYYVYMYVFNDIPRYIGKGYGRRYKPQEHLYDNTKNIVFRRFLNKYINNIKVRFLNENLTEEQSLYWEKYWIAAIGRRSDKTGTLLNLTAGGEGTAGIKQRPEWIEARLATRKLHNNLKCTESTKTKIRNTLMGRKMPEEQRLKMLGKQASEETKAKMSQSQQKRYDNGAKGYWTGKTMPEEIRKKISDSHSGANNASAKINENIVKSMRSDYEMNNMTPIEISNKYKISVTQTRRILKRERWKNV